MSTVQRAARNLGALASAQLIARASGLVLTAFLARHLGEVDFGSYSLCLSFTTMFGVLARLGVRQIMLRDIVVDVDRAPRFISTAVVAHVFQGLATIAVIMLVAWPLGYRGARLVGMAIMSVSAVFLAYESLFYAVFEARERMGVVALHILLRQGVWVVLATIGILTQQSYLVFIVALTATSALVAGVAGYVVWSRFHRFSLRWHAPTGRHLLKAGLPLAGAAVLVDIYLKVDMVMVDQMLSPTELGHYAAAYRLVSALIFLSASFFTVVFPIFSRLHREDPGRLSEAYTRSLKAISIGLVPISAGIAGLSIPLMRMVFDVEFEPGAPALAIAIWGVALQGLAAVMGRMIVAVGRQRVIFYISFCSVLTNVGLNLVFIPRFGIAGAAAASLMTIALVVGLNYVALGRQFGRLPVVSLLWRVYLAGGILCAGLFALREWPLWATVPLGAVGYGLLIWLLRVLDAEDRLLLRSLLKRSGLQEAEGAPKGS